MTGNRRVQLQVEQLEDRTLLAGNVVLSLLDPVPNRFGDETVFITGDDAGNNIILAVVPLRGGGVYDAPGYFTGIIVPPPREGRWLFVFDGDGSTIISPGTTSSGGTLLDGSPRWAAVLIQDVDDQDQGIVPIEVRQIVVNLAEGPDTFQVNYFESRARRDIPNIPLTRNIRAWKGMLTYFDAGGNDSFVVDPAILPDIILRGFGPLPHNLYFSPGQSPNPPSATPGVQLNLGQGGSNQVSITGATFLGSLSIASGDGDDSVEITSGVTIRGALRLDMGRGNNSVRIASNVRIDEQLWMRGSDGNDSLVIDGSIDPNILRGNINFIAGDGNNLLSVLTTTVYGQLYYRAGTGNDRLLLRHSDFGIGIDMVSGSGNDYFEMFRSTFGVLPNDPDGIGTVSGQVRFIKVAGDGSLKLLQSSVHGDLRVSLNSGNDSVVVQSSQIDGSTSLYTYGPRPDRDVVSITGSRFYSNVAVRTGAGNDFITVAGRNQFYGSLILDAGVGDDVLQVSNNSFYATVSVALGAGNDFANIFGNGFFGPTAIIDGGSGLDRISQTRNQGKSNFRNFP
jgi:hypothetical protein